MKKITFLVLATLCSFMGYSQYPENFESSNVTAPNGFPAGWLVTDNGVGSVSWEITNNTALVFSGEKAAYINRQEIGMGNTSEDWLISPLVAIPTNGQLRFSTKQALAGDNGTLYQIRISSSTTQSSLASYTVLQQWTETQLNQVFNVAEQKVVDFPASLFGTNVHIAFVRVYTQPTAAIGGDRLIIDDINVVQGCSAPANVHVNPTTLTGGTVSWYPAGTENLGFDIYLVPSGAPAPTSSIMPTYSGVNEPSTPFTFTIPDFLLPNTAYDVYVRTQCLTGNSLWSEVETFITTPSTCPKPISGTGTVSATTANLSWTEVGTASAWEVFVTAENLVPDNNAPIDPIAPGYYQASTNTNFIVAGLIPMTQYSFYVRAICSPTDVSAWTKIYTEPGDKIILNAFVDANNNGIREETEIDFPYGNYTFVKNNDGFTYYISSQFGSYTLLDQNPSNTYNFNFEINSDLASYYAVSPTNYTNLSITEGSGIQNLYFPITITQVYNDVQINVTPLSVPRPGFPFSHRIAYKNVGHNTLSGTITYTKNNSNVAISLVAPLSTTTLLNGFTFDYSNLLPGQTRYINVNMLVATIPTVNLGDVLTHTATITASETDVNLTNNSSTVVQTVVGSYDPNDKNEARGSNVQIGQFNANDYLYYTIRFQNSGTASAETVRIEDTLESEFDFASIQMLSASHEYVMQRINNKIIWTFNNINLPSENQDEPGSHGYVTFKIKLNPGFAVGDVIENTAEIYFDFNPAIITNTFQTTFVPNLSTSTFDENSVVVYPNPAKEMVQISLQHSTESISNIVIFDMIGKTIKTVSGNNAQQVSIPINDLATGVYLIEITTETNLKQVRKLIIK